MILSGTLPRNGHIGFTVAVAALWKATASRRICCHVACRHPPFKIPDATCARTGVGLAGVPRRQAAPQVGIAKFIACNFTTDESVKD